jgi:rod shape-determining protein MreC
MRNLLNFLARYNNLILFLLLEGIALYLVVTGNDYQNSRIVKSIKIITLGVDRKIANTRAYLNLHDINTNIVRENVTLKNRMERIIKREGQLFFSVSDTILQQQYIYTSAEIVNNSTNRQKNFLTLSKGKKQGIDVDMALTGPDGVAGIIVSSSDNFSVAMSLLNLDFRLSVRLKPNGYFGSLSWDGRDYRYAIINEIPQHVVINKGDTVQTTGYSAIFPEGLLVGVVSDFEKAGGDFYKIKVLLATNFKKLNYVSIIGNLRRDEQKEIEKTYQ